MKHYFEKEKKTFLKNPNDIYIYIFIYVKQINWR